MDNIASEAYALSTARPMPSDPSHQNQMHWPAYALGSAHHNGCLYPFKKDNASTQYQQQQQLQYQRDVFLWSSRSKAARKYWEEGGLLPRLPPRATLGSDQVLFFVHRH